MIKVIILDRDGVINKDSPLFIKSAAEWHAIPNSLKAIAKLNKAGYKVVVATNQSGLARGYFTREVLEAIHQKMKEELAKEGGYLDGIFICPHAPEDECNCRKPKPGLLLEIAASFQVKPKEMLVVGDSMRDIAAARAAGCECVLVKTGNGNKTLLKEQDLLKGVTIFDDLAAAVDAILDGM